MVFCIRAHFVNMLTFLKWTLWIYQHKKGNISCLALLVARSRSCRLDVSVSKHASAVLFIGNFFLPFVEGTTSLAASTSPYNCSLVRICHDTSIGLQPLSQTTACSPNGVAPFFLSISYNQPLFLIAQSGDAISGERDSDVEWQPKTPLVKKCPGVIRVSHTPLYPGWTQPLLPKFTFVLALWKAES